MIRLSLAVAIASLLNKKEHEGYRNVGHNLNAKELYTLMGLKASPMLYNYMSGKTKTIEPERAIVLFDKFDILIDDWLTPEELQQDVTNRELSMQIAAQPIQEIIEEIVVVERLETEAQLRRGLRKLIARYY